MQEELADSLEAAGLEPAVLDSQGLTALQIARELARWEPHAVWSINFIPDLAKVSSRLGIPYAAWEIDPVASPIPSVDPNGLESRYTWIFTWREARRQVFLDAGYRHVDVFTAAHVEAFARVHPHLDPRERRAAKLKSGDDALVL